MCTLTYIPRNNGSFLLASNRDELHSRGVAIPPQEYDFQGRKLLFAKDVDAGGTWLLAGESKILCLLNGAFERHHKNPPYKKSRGIVLLESEAAISLQDFSISYDFEGIEPHTIVSFDLKGDKKMEELRWDGKLVHHKKLDPARSAIWSSVTLYDRETREAREKYFEQFLSDKDLIQPADLLLFHRFSDPEDTERNIRIQNPFRMTVSISVLEYKASEKCLDWHYEDLIRDDITKVSAELSRGVG